MLSDLLAYSVPALKSIVLGGHKTMQLHMPRPACTQSWSSEDTVALRDTVSQATDGSPA